jgi:bifunctional DNA-binding transcriptional regulator/antitoxin component of YhaV-PrlF toxin-antitoxin module
MMSSTVGERGQITIDKALRDELGIKAGWKAIQRRVGDRIEVRFLPPRHRRSLKGILAEPGGPAFPTEAEFRDATENAWGAAVSEKHTFDQKFPRHGIQVRRP